MSQPTAERSAPEVGVVIPMFNAAATIEETLDSVQAQTYPSLDIVVVDDGSTDGSPDLVVKRAKCDPRLRLIRQENSGVAAARNAGVLALDCQYLAFVDADDLWAPDKISLQMAALTEAGETAGLVYTWFALIDDRSSVVSLDKQPRFEGRVLRALCSGNFIGNGSSMLVRRSVFEAVNGFDSALRDQDAQGCEDLRFGLAAAELTEFRVVPRYMTGYRVTHDNMSSDVLRMWRSATMVLAPYRERYPEWTAELRAHSNGLAEWLLTRSLEAGRLAPASRLFLHLIGSAPWRTLRQAGGYVRLYFRATTARRLNRGAERMTGAATRRRPNYLKETW